MKQAISLTILFLLAASTPGCAGDQADDPSDIDGPEQGDTAPRIQLRAASASELGGPGGLTTEDEGGESIEIVAAHVQVRDIELDFVNDDLGCAQLEELLEPPVSCEDDDKVVIEGPFEVDLLTGQATPSLEGLTIPEAQYDRADVRIQSEDGPSFEAIVGVEGEVSSVHIALDFTEDARFESDQGVSLEQEAGALLLRLDVDAWFQGVPLTDCIEDGDVEIVGDEAIIDEDTSGKGRCSDVENVLEDNIKDSGELLPS